MNGQRYVAWARGYGGKIKASEAHDELERIRAANEGELTAVVVVEHARQKGSVLHPQVFDRGKASAAEEYYKERARLLIRSVVVRYEEGPDQPTRIYHVVREEPSLVALGRTVKVYGEIEEAMADPTQRGYVLQQALIEAVRWKQKYNVLKELSTIFAAIDTAAGKG